MNVERNGLCKKIIDLPCRSLSTRLQTESAVGWWIRPVELCIALVNIGIVPGKHEMPGISRNRTSVLVISECNTRYFRVEVDLTGEAPSLCFLCRGNLHTQTWVLQQEKQGDKVHNESEAKVCT